MLKILSLSALAAVAVLLAADVAFACSGVSCGKVTLPEPGTLALLATGVGGLVIAKFRKRK